MQLKNPPRRDAEFWDSVALGNSLFSPLNPVLEKLLSLDQLRELYSSVRQPDGSNIFNRILQKMHITCVVNETDLARVPAQAAAVAVANHPFGILDGVLLGALLLNVRPDLKILTNYVLTGVPELDEYCIPLDPFQEGSTQPMNERGVRGALNWLRSGGMLLVFPAGEVAHFQWMKGVVDPKWNTTAVRLARNSGASMLPIFIDGRNSVPFQLAGMVHPRLRTANLPKEFLQKKGSSIEVRVGSVVPPETLKSFSSVAEGTSSLRWKSYALANRASKAHKKPRKIPQIPFIAGQKALAEPVSGEILAQEIDQIPHSACLESNEECAVYCAEAAKIPQILREIGRLRELSFREAGEGTGKSLDLDSFDDYYCHLVLWNRAKNEIVGAYRLAKTTEILSKFREKGLYTNTLFRFQPGFFDRLGPAIELGRSFIRPEYQRKYAPLLLLWKAIGRYVALNPDYPVLFGAVSISNSYLPASRTMMHDFFQTHFAAHPLSGLVKPRRAFRSARLKYWDIRAFRQLVRDPEDLSGSVSDFESDGKGIPILLKQYLKVGGQVLAFNVDGQFSDVLDGLIVVDLRATDRKNLQRYLGNEGAASFLRHHRLT